MVASEKKAKFGGMITVSCTFGNEMLSKGETKYSTSLKCQNDGKFAPEAPLCTPIEDYCVSKRGNLPGVMSVEPIEVKPNTVITYSCAEGFLIEDTNSTLKKQHATRLCRPKSRKRGTLVDEFKGGEPLCERDNNYCSIIGGNNTHFSPQDGTGLNESVFIECDEGFEFGKNHTSMTLTCSKNG